MLKKVIKRLGSFIGLMLVSVGVFAASCHVVIGVVPNCGGCAQAESILSRAGIPFSITSARPGNGPAPQIYLNGQQTNLGEVLSRCRR